MPVPNGGGEVAEVKDSGNREAISFLSRLGVATEGASASSSRVAPSGRVQKLGCGRSGSDAVAESVGGDGNRYHEPNCKCFFVSELLATAGRGRPCWPGPGAGHGEGQARGSSPPRSRRSKSPTPQGSGSPLATARGSLEEA